MKMTVRQVLTALCLLVAVNVESVESRQRRRQPMCKSSRIDVESADGVKIEPIKSSRIYIDSFKKPFLDRDTLSFEFKTHSTNGTLFYMNRRNDGYDMVSGEIIDGFLEFKIRCMSSYADLRIPKFRINDGEWHQIKFQRQHRKGLFMLDGSDFLGKYYVTCKGFTSINIGNTNPEHNWSVSVNELKMPDGLLSACIRNVETTTGISAPPHYIAISECV